MPALAAQNREPPLWRRPLGEQLGVAFRRVLPPLVVFGVAIWALSQFVVIGPNRTGSLPEPLFIVIKNAKAPERGGLVAFRPGPNRYYPADSLFVKRLAGLPGDTITHVDGVFYVNGEPAAITKPRAKDGQALTPGPTGVLPGCRYFVATESPDGYDSRYSDIGWIGCEQIVGLAYAFR